MRMRWKKVETICVGEVVIPLHKGIFSENILAALENGSYERQEARELPRIIEDGERILEIGGGIGYISTLAAADERTSCVRVYEANPKLIPIIKEVHSLNGVKGVEIINGVLSDSCDEKFFDFYIRKDFWASSLSAEPWEYEKVISTPNLSFSDAIIQFQPTLIICDIEGGEQELFATAELPGVSKVYLEVHQAVLGGSGMKALFDAMSAKGFHYDQRHSCGQVVLFTHIDS